MASATIIKANTSFSFVGPTGPVSVRKGSTFHKESNLLRGLSEDALENNFDPFTPDHDVERATAAPGERRKGGPRRGKASSSKEKDGEEKEQATVEQGAQTATPEAEKGAEERDSAQTGK